MDRQTDGQAARPTMRPMRTLHNNHRESNLFDEVDFAANEETHANDGPNSCVHTYIVITANSISNMNKNQCMKVKNPC